MALAVCARCPAALGRSCCEPVGEERLALLTWADAVRIRDLLRIPFSSFIEEEWMDGGDARDYERDRPLYRGYFKDGPLRRTLRRVEGGCVFFEKGRGCTLPREARPTPCLLYPFDLRPDGRWSFQVTRYGSVEAAAGKEDACLAVEEGRRMVEVLRAFGVRRAEVEVLGERLRREVQAGWGGGRSGS